MSTYQKHFRINKYRGCTLTKEGSFYVKGGRVEKENNYRVRDIYSDNIAGGIRKSILLCDR